MQKLENCVEKKDVGYRIEETVLRWFDGIERREKSMNGKFGYERVI